MRPQKFRAEMNKAIRTWLDRKDITQLLRLVPEMVRVWDKWSAHELDYRSGAETYGYGGIQQIENTFNYIQDRWKCAFRLRWIIDGLVNGHF